VGESYIQVWAPDKGRVPFPSIITIWGAGTLWAINWRRGRLVMCSYFFVLLRIKMNIIHCSVELWAGS